MMYLPYLRGMNTLSGETTLSKLFCLPSEKGSTLKGKNLLPIGSKFFPFRVDPFLEGAWCTENQIGTHKSYLPFKMT